MSITRRYSDPISPLTSVAVVALFCLAASVAESASVLALADGTIWGTPDSEQNSGSGSAPVTATAAYARPPVANDGHFSASAFAKAGRLGAASELSVSNAPGYLSAQHDLYGTSRADGYASFQDRWYFSEQPLDTVGRLRLTVRFVGAGSGSATGAIADTSGKLDFDITSLGEFNDVHETQGYHAGSMQVANETVVLELEFLYGRPLNVVGYLLARVQLSSEPTVYSYSGGGASSFDQTAELTALEVQNAQGQWTTDYALATESGAQYPFQVPEPTPPDLAVAALAALTAIRTARR